MSADDLAEVARAPRIRERPEAASKLDSTLLKLILSVELAADGKAWNRGLRTPTIPDGCIPAEITVVIRHTGDDEQTFIDLGFRETTHSRGAERSFAVGFISPARLADLASIPYVVSVIGPSPIWPELHDSIGDVRVDRIRNANPLASGDGVVIAIIDSGIDSGHRSFCGSNDRTRILGIWDQELDAKLELGETAGPGGLPGQGQGTVYTRDDIDFTLGSIPGPAVKVRHRDKAFDESVEPFGQTSTTRNKRDPDEKRPHGTHVAGIAAGDGSPGSCCHPLGFRFVGMAPAAELLIVATGRMMGDNPAVVTAFDWIANHPGVAGKPIVVNISQGFNLGAHDGSTTLEERITNFLAPGPGQPTRVVVKSAGNEATTDRHLHETVPAQGQLTVPLVVEKDGGEGRVEFWLPPSGSGLEFQLRVGGDSTNRIPVTQFVMEGPGPLPSSGSENEQTSIFFHALAAHSDNGHPWIAFEISERGMFASDSVRIDIFNPTANPVTFDAWIEKNGKKGLRFHAHDSSEAVRATRSATLTIPGTATDVISVANGRSSLIPESSRGPARGTHPADRSKPTVTAPGAGVTSAEAGGNHCCPCLCGGPWTEMDGGTSMSAPHVTGLVALMLQKNANLPLADIHTLLRNNTIDGDHDDPDGWGAGRIDGFAAWSAVTEQPPGPPPPGPPPPGGRVAPGPLPAITARPPRAPAAPPLDATVMFHPVVALASSSPEVAAVAAAFSRHLSEVRRLINTNRRVATLWHRADGPQLLRRLGLGTTDPAAPSPLRGAADRDYLARMFEQLARYGSPRLQASVRRHGPLVLALLDAPLATRRRSSVPTAQPR